jgi:hypothetical protein
VDVPLTLGSRIVPVPQLPPSNSNSSQRLNCSSLTHQLFTSLHSTSRLAAISHQPPTLLTDSNSTDQTLDLPYLKHLGTDHVENTAPHCCSSNVAMGTRLFAKPLLSNGCFIFVTPRSLSNNRSTCYIAPSLRLFVQIAYRRTTTSSFPRAVLVTSVIGLAFLPCGSVLMESTLQLLPLLPP